MKVIIATADADAGEALLGRLQAIDASLRCQLQTPHDAIAPCALLITLGNCAPAAPPMCVRWHLGDCPDAPTDLDAVLPWPVADSELSGQLAQARAMLRRRAGIARPEVLDRALRRIVELASESIEVVDPSIRLLYANPAFEQVTGWAMEDAVGFTTGELFRAGTHDPDYYAGIGAALRGGQVWRGPLVARRRDGQLSFQEATLAPVHDDAGVAVAYVAIKRDAERDSVAQSAGLSSGQRLQTMIEEAADAFLVHDAGGTIVDANPSACRMLGCARDDLVRGRRLQDFVAANDSARMEAVFRDVRPGDPQALETRFLRPGAAPLEVGLRVGAFSFGGERFVLTLARDIGERVALEAALRQRSDALGETVRTLQATQRELVQREKHAALGSLVAGVAHEVNTPLGVGLTAITLAREHLAALRSQMESPRPSRGTVLAQVRDLDEALEVCEQNLRRAGQLVTDFKKIAVDQAGEVQRSVELVSYLKSVVANYAPTLRRERIAVAVTGVPVELMTRPGAIAQVITNLLQNAVVHAFEADHPHRRVTLDVSADGPQVRIQVADNGRGMAAETAARIFDPFFTTRMGAGGSGLGMTIVHNLMLEVLGGSIAVDTAPGEGLRVTLCLPVTPVQPASGKTAQTVA